MQKYSSKISTSAIDTDNSCAFRCSVVDQVVQRLKGRMHMKAEANTRLKGYGQCTMTKTKTNSELLSNTGIITREKSERRGFGVPSSGTYIHVIHDILLFSPC